MQIIIYKIYNNMDTKKVNTDSIPFWADNPNVLFQKEYILEFFPVESMTYNQKLNSITRTVFLLMIIGFALSKNLRVLVVSGITAFAIYLLHFYHEKEKEKKNVKKTSLEIIENFDNPAIAYMKEAKIDVRADTFDVPTPSNPFSNVLNTDIADNPNKRPAPPAFNTSNDILAKAKRMVSDANPDQPDIADKLFTDLGDQFVFEQSLRPFYSNAATTTPNDQGAFADFCYGSMVSCKEGNNFACARNMSRHVGI